MPEGLLVILRSENGRDGWTPVLPAGVPAWVKDEKVMGKLVAGHMCSDPATGDIAWYRAEKVDSTGETQQ